ncbi:MAG: fumarylacetoacetase [Bacteroidia bacterium]|nr:fumarylacetoacetase [Bacteroidia bacterium]MCZ2247826.1 fumarylacetoacetase [Bacteroidia bacterium]
MKSWLSVSPDSDFSIYNFPFGVYCIANQEPALASILGNQIIDLAAMNKLGYFKELNISQSVFENKYLNDFIALGKEKTNKVRNTLIEIFSNNNAELALNEKNKSLILKDYSTVTMLMPVKVGNYTDFYSSIQHATNVGTMFRDPKNALLPNYRHIPIGYHGRASSITVSGTDFHRPKGQIKPPDSEQPYMGPTQQLDFELEIAFITGKSTTLGQSITTQQANDYIFGLVLFNDWSARDFQSWEYVPLGPFLAKNFCSSVSPWVVTLEALEQFRVASEKQVPEVLPYLQCPGNNNYDINLEVFIRDEKGTEMQVSSSNFKYMYWSMKQQLAHHTVNGCNIEVGDMYASGTISGSQPHEYGSMLEITWRGTKPLQMPDGSTRKFINDNDTVIMKGYALKDNVRVGFGKVMTKVLPAI